MEYRMSHQAPDLDSVADGSAATLDDLEPVMPDVYDHPEWYGDDRAAIRAMRAARGRPGTMVRIFRAVPHGVDTINAGDWVTTSQVYAMQHAIQDDEPANDWPVIVARVPASQLVSEGNDICEYGYAGPTLGGCKTA